MIGDSVSAGGGGSTPPAIEGTGQPEGIARSHGHYYYVRNGAASPLLQHQRFLQGYSYEGKGRIIARNGSVVHLTEGEMVTFSGEHLSVPPNTQFP